MVWDERESKLGDLRRARLSFKRRVMATFEMEEIKE